MSGWIPAGISLPTNFSQREIAMIGFRFESETAIPDYSINIGEIAIYDGILGTIQSNKENSFVTVSYSEIDAVLFSINWPNGEHVNSTLFDLQGKAIKSNRINLNGITNYSLDTKELASGTYMIRFADEKNISETKKIIIK